MTQKTEISWYQDWRGSLSIILLLLPLTSLLGVLFMWFAGPFSKKVKIIVTVVYFLISLFLFIIFVAILVFLFSVIRFRGKTSEAVEIKRRAQVQEILNGAQPFKSNEDQQPLSYKKLTPKIATKSGVKRHD